MLLGRAAGGGRRVEDGASERPCLEIETLEGLALSTSGMTRMPRPAGAPCRPG